MLRLSSKKERSCDSRFINGFKLHQEIHNRWGERLNYNPTRQNTTLINGGKLIYKFSWRDKSARKTLLMRVIREKVRKISDGHLGASRGI